MSATTTGELITKLATYTGDTVVAVMANGWGDKALCIRTEDGWEPILKMEGSL